MKARKERPWVGRSYKRGYRKSRRFDTTCRSHGSCGYCQSGRQHKHHRQGLSEAVERILREEVS